MVQKAVFLDRDGVINQPIIREGRPYPPERWSEFVWMDDVQDTLRILHSRDYLLFVVTNQPDVARGRQPLAAVEAFHKKIREELPITAIYVCIHDDADKCGCRKPKPGMLLEASRDYGVDLSRAWMVGDRWRDIEAGQAAGCRTIFLDHHYLERKPGAPTHTIHQLRQLLTFIQ